VKAFISKRALPIGIDARWRGHADDPADEANRG
jgi:hypothetical protein